jgi:hypothetical protein
MITIFVGRDAAAAVAGTSAGPSAGSVWLARRIRKRPPQQDQKDSLTQLSAFVRHNH